MLPYSACIGFPGFAFCPSVKNNMWIKSNMVHWWSDPDKRKPKYSDKNLYHCYCVDHVSQMDCLGIELVPLQ